MNNKISIIIPALNEEAQIGKLLEYVLANSSPKNISDQPFVVMMFLTRKRVSKSTVP